MERGRIQGLPKFFDIESTVSYALL